MGNLMKAYKQKQNFRSLMLIAHILVSWNTKLHRKSLYFLAGQYKNTIDNMVVKL